jgi:hypothetical protein
MAKRQMQLLMEETEERKGRDVRAIRWLIGNLTTVPFPHLLSEDADMEQFMMAISDSFNMDWGAEVWKKVGNPIEDDNEDSCGATYGCDCSDRSSDAACRVFMLP